jgi:NOL1/NOP2/fmu family ribosome biogenesis protein
LRYFEERFGIPLGVFEGFILLERPQAYWLMTQSPHVEKLTGLKIRSTGIPVLRKIKQRLKPTTAAIQTFGSTASKNVVTLDRRKLSRLLKPTPLRISLPISPGYIILAHENHVLGCGLYTGQRLLSQIPKSYMPRLSNLLREDC